MSFAVCVHKTGGPGVLRWEAWDVGVPGAGEVRIRHTAIGVNFIDIYFRRGLYPADLPFVPGREAAGVVVEVGANVSTVRPGDRVAYAAVQGSYCEERVIPAAHLIKLPNEIDDITAAALMLQGMTARYLVRDVYRIKGGETILVHAAAGGVGQLLCQWASALGAFVIGTVSSDEKAEFAKSRGCSYPIVYTRENFVERVIKITRGNKVPVVYDSVGKDTFLGSLQCLRPCGLMVVYGQSSGVIPLVEVNLLARMGSLRLTRPVLSTFTNIFVNKAR